MEARKIKGGLKRKKRRTERKEQKNGEKNDQNNVNFNWDAKLRMTEEFRTLYKSDVQSSCTKNTKLQKLRVLKLPTTVFYPIFFFLIIIFDYLQ